MNTDRKTTLQRKKSAVDLLLEYNFCYCSVQCFLNLFSSISLKLPRHRVAINADVVPREKKNLLYRY
jgi:hypothetical protein